MKSFPHSEYTGMVSLLCGSSGVRLKAQYNEKLSYSLHWKGFSQSGSFDAEQDVPCNKSLSHTHHTDVVLTGYVFSDGQ